MLARLDPRFLDRLWFPLGEQSKDETRAEAARAGLEVARRARRARRRASSPAATTATSSSGTGSLAADGPIVDEDGRELGRHAGFWRFTPGQRRGLGVAAGGPVYALRSEPRDEHRRRRASGGARHATRFTLADGCTSRSSARRRSSATARRRVGADVTPTDGGFRLGLDSRPTASPPGRRRCSTRDEVVVGAGHDRFGSCRNLSAPLAAFEPDGRMTGDEITLTMPRDAAFHEVAHLVLGGSPRAST